MSVNWNTVTTQLEQSVGDAIGSAWSNARAGASAQFAAIIAAGKQVEKNKDSMTQAEYNSLKLIQQRAMEGVLQAYAGISIDIAEQAAAAAWNVVVGALKAAYPALGLLA